ncbi:MAG: hypothetical protein ABJJ53_11910 [Sulfitobacter sp.]
MAKPPHFSAAGGIDRWLETAIVGLLAFETGLTTDFGPLFTGGGDGMFHVTH